MNVPSMSKVAIRSSLRMKFSDAGLVTSATYSLRAVNASQLFHCVKYSTFAGVSLLSLVQDVAKLQNVSAATRVNSRLFFFIIFISVC